MTSRPSKWPWATALGLLLIIAACLGAPLYAAVAGVNPFRSDIEGVTWRGGKAVPVLAQNTEGLGLGATPIGPGWAAYPLGADGQGRDVASRLLYGGRTSLAIAAAATLLTLALAGAIGVCAGALGGITDAVLRWLLDMVWAFPVFLLAIALSAVLADEGLRWGPFTLSADNPALTAIILGVCLHPLCRPPDPRRGAVAAQTDFVEAAISLGGTWRHVMRRHILAACRRRPVALCPHHHALDLLTEASLSVLAWGCGRQAPGWGHVDRGWTGVDLQPASRGDRPGLGRSDHCAAAQPPVRRTATHRGTVVRLLGRLGQAIAVLAGISILIFLIFFATPGANPASRLAGRGAAPETLALVRAQFGARPPTARAIRPNDAAPVHHRRPHQLRQPG